MQNFKPLSLALISGVLLSLSWPSNGIPLLLMIAFIPLMHISFTYAKKISKLHLFTVIYTAFFLWNALTTWWIANATLFGAIFAVVFNSLFMTSVFLLFHAAKKISGKAIAYLSLVSFWTAFEYLHMNWELSWSWLNLGNGFASHTLLIQWYELTGVLGGTVWIILVNILLFELLLAMKQLNFNATKIIKSPLPYISAAAILFPIIFSFYLYRKNSDPAISKARVIVIQPNIDPYNEKFGGLSTLAQLQKMLSLAEQMLPGTQNFDSLTKSVLIVFPETSLPDGIWENNLQNEDNIILLKNFISKYPYTKILIGMSSLRYYRSDEMKTPTARRFISENGWYDAFNSALTLDSSKNINIYHKSKLVPGVERMPYPQFFGFLENYSINLGGITGSLGMQKHRTPLLFRNFIPLTLSHENQSPATSKEFLPKLQLSIAPSICYESVYGEFMSQYIKKGADLLCIITNDGWWGNTPGYRQHLDYARLRAIETRRSVARSANTGISAFIDKRGNIISKTSWWKPSAISNYLDLNHNLTFYVKFGDYLGRISAVISLLLIIFVFIAKLLWRINTKSSH